MSMPTIMIRVEPGERINRWYSVSVQGTLFDPVAVVCSWGNRRTSHQRRRVLQVDAPESATELAAAIVAQKIRPRLPRHWSTGPAH